MIQTQPDDRQLGACREQREVPAGAARRHRLVALRSKKTVIRAGFGIYYGLLDNLSYRLDQDPPFNTVYAVKGTSAGVATTLSFANISPTANYSALGFNDSVIPSGVQPNLQTPTVESYTLKIEQQLLAEHHAERRLYRFARISRTALDRHEPAERARIPIPRR